MRETIEHTSAAFWCEDNAKYNYHSGGPFTRAPYKRSRHCDHTEAYFCEQHVCPTCMTILKNGKPMWIDPTKVKEIPSAGIGVRVKELD